MRKNNKTGKRLRLTPLILGGYAAFLGFGLVAIGLVEIKEGIGIIRLLIGLGMAGFGLLGIWDGVRDLVGPDKRQKQASASQFILTDTSGNRTSNVTVEVLQKQLESLMESDKGGVFKLQILPPFPVQEIGNISQIFCIFYETFRLTVFLDVSEGGYESSSPAAFPAPVTAGNTIPLKKTRRRPMPCSIRLSPWAAPLRFWERCVWIC